jgi:hypothetical protein
MVRRLDGIAPFKRIDQSQSNGQGINFERRPDMKKLDFNRPVILILLFISFVFAFQARADEKIYLMTGKITAINLNSNIVVIEVPLEKGLFIVGGPLSSTATLKKGGLPRV